MKTASFFYDITSQEWKECNDPIYATKEIEQVPVRILLRCQGDTMSQRLVWCEKHKTYESIADCN